MDGGHNMTNLYLSLGVSSFCIIIKEGVGPRYYFSWDHLVSSGELGGISNIIVEITPRNEFLTVFLYFYFIKFCFFYFF